ncbi:hypothetical protein AK812_SmicGene44752 [Symbiodinium microadriaticum]|uniref:Uncharacterized protein n=1 Tax=Symbiodinium microadriaticum TaxID=2951 RepID=A0A1Q9BXM1_SYMMI|nr:hypothetical protein AK812_SmicGene44752 [Symbiodinium microadriaticum]
MTWFARSAGWYKVKKSKNWYCLKCVRANQWEVAPQSESSEQYMQDKCHCSVEDLQAYPTKRDFYEKWRRAVAASDVAKAEDAAAAAGLDAGEATGSGVSKDRAQVLAAEAAASAAATAEAAAGGTPVKVQL